MFAAVLLLILGLWSIVIDLNAYRPLRQKWLLFPSFFAALFTIELPAHFIVVQAVIAAGLAWFGALDHVIGWIGLVLLATGWLGRIVLLVQGWGSRQVVDAALETAGIPRSGSPVPTRRVVVAAPFRSRAVERIRDIEFRRVAGRTLRLDVYRPRGAVRGLPVMLYLHGGAWTVGDKREQGLPMINHLASNGWLCVTANYRLSPAGTFPDHLSDAKAAIAWIKREAHRYGADPSFIAVSGGSAGGHLAAMAGLTANDPVYQQGFESSDTRIQAAVPLYGVYDLTNRAGEQPDEFVSVLMEPIVMKAFLSEEPQFYADSSPLDRVNDDAPPFLVVQGDRDTLAPVAEARAFVRLLESTAHSPVVFMEFPGAPHAFDLWYSPRTARMVEGVLSFINAMRSRAGTGADRTRGGLDDHAD